MNELQIQVKQELGIIDFNYEEIKQGVTASMELYKNIVTTEENLAETKKEVATLTKIKDAADKERIRVKKKCMEPYDEFEKKIKEITSLIAEPIELIKGQLEEFEIRRKKAKKESVQAIYSELIGELAEYLPLDKIYNPKWENATFSIKNITEEIETVASSTQLSIDTLKGMNSEVVDKALTAYKADLSLANAIAYINKYEQQKAEILAKEEVKRKLEEEQKRIAEDNRLKEEERKRVAEEERIRLEERAKIKIENDSKVVEVFIEPTYSEDTKELPFSIEPSFDAEEAPFETHIWVRYKMYLTEREIINLEMYLDSVGVEYQRGVN